MSHDLIIAMTIRKSSVLSYDLSKHHFRTRRTGHLRADGQPAQSAQFVERRHFDELASSVTASLKMPMPGAARYGRRRQSIRCGRRYQRDADHESIGGAGIFRKGTRVMQAIETLPVPVIGLINGYAWRWVRTCDGMRLGYRCRACGIRSAEVSLEFRRLWRHAAASRGWSVVRSPWNSSPPDAKSRPTKRCAYRLANHVVPGSQLM
jgi:hypothetical protein